MAEFTLHKDFNLCIQKSQHDFAVGGRFQPRPPAHQRAIYEIHVKLNFTVKANVWCFRHSHDYE